MLLHLFDFNKELQSNYIIKFYEQLSEYQKHLKYGWLFKINSIYGYKKL